VRRRFIATSFFLVAANAFCQSFCRFFGAATVNIFSSVNKNDANVTRYIFFGRCFEWLSLAWQLSSHSSESLRFSNATISQDSLATRLRCRMIFNYVVASNLLLSLSVKEFSKSVSI